MSTGPSSSPLPWAAFHALVDADSDERRRAIAALRAEDPVAARELEELLDAHDRSDPLLDRPEELAEEARHGKPAAGDRPSDPVPSPPRRVGAYELTRRLGAGGMGEVFLGVRTVDGAHQRVAVKLLRAGAADADLLQRFARERATLARLEHPGIARLIDHGTAEDGRPYVVMEYVDGAPIDRVCEQRRLGLEARLELFASVCDAVHAAHRALVVHRDIKPSNVLVDDRPRLVDFGIAKDLEDAEATGTVQRRLTPSHASPEQLRGEPVTTATDVYSLGVLLCQLLTGSLPYPATGDAAGAVGALTRSILEGRRLRPSAILAQTAEADGAHRPPFAPHRLRGDLDAVVQRALADEPDRRYPSAAALAEDVRRHLAGLPVQARPDSALYRLGKLVRRRPVSFALGGLAVALLLAAVVALSIQGIRLRSALERADHERVVSEAQRRRADLSNRLMRGLFQEAGPSRAQGRELSVLEAVERGGDRITRSLAREPLDRLRLEITLAELYNHLGRDEEAERRLAAARGTLAALESAGVSPAWARAELDEVSARVAYARGDYEHALELFGGIDLEALSGPVDRGLVLTARGTALLALGRQDEAENRFAEALDLLEGRADAAVERSVARTGLARVLASRDDFEAALALQETSLRDLTSELGDEADPEVLRTRYERALTLERLGRATEAADEYAATLAGQRRVLGEPHPDTQVTAGRLAAVLQSLDRFDEATELYEGSLDQLGDAPSPQRRTLLVNLGWNLHEQGRLDEADRLYRRVEEELRATGAPEWSYLTVLNNRGLLLLERGDRRGAESLLRRSLEIAERLYGANHSVVAFPLTNLARLDHERGAAAPAEEAYRRSLAIRRDALGERHPDVAQTALGLASLLCDGEQSTPGGGRASEGLALAREALAIREERASAYKAALARVEVGACALALGREGDALENLLLAREPVLSVRGATDPRVRRIDRLVGALGGV